MHVMGLVEVWACKPCWGSWGANAGLSLFLDSSAAKAFASTRGIGRMRHLSVKTLWLQGAVHLGQLKLFKVWGEVNPADVLTKYQDRASVQRLLALAGICVDPIVKDDRVEGRVSVYSHVGSLTGPADCCAPLRRTWRSSPHPAPDPFYTVTGHHC